MEPLLIMVALGAYAVASGAYGWAWLLYCKLEKLITNHLQHVDAHLKDECEDDCPYCD